MTPLLKEYKNKHKFNLYYVLNSLIKKDLNCFLIDLNNRNYLIIKIFEIQPHLLKNIFVNKENFLNSNLPKKLKDSIKRYIGSKLINKFIKFFNVFSDFNYLNYRDISLSYIYILDLINSYRGWRHSNGLPTKGQRTWSNGWTAFRSNLLFREYQLELAKKFYKDFNYSIKEKRLAFMAEQVNKIWSVQWEKEWLKSKKKRKTALKYNYRYFRVDIGRLAQGNVNSKKVRKNRKKQQDEKRNHFILGFDKGFTKYLLNNNTLEDPVKLKQKSNLRKKKIKELEIQFKEKEKQKVLKQVKKQLKSDSLKKKLMMKNKKKKTIWD